MPVVALYLLKIKVLPRRRDVKSHLNSIKTLASKFAGAVEAVAVPAVTSITEVTKHIRFTANAVSRDMDTANGGYLEHGGFHRLIGGHSIVDLSLWQKHGINFPIEWAKDLLTASGQAFPGVETFVTKGLVSARFAADWGALNIGDVAGVFVGGLGTATRCVMVYRDSSALDNKLGSTALSGGSKVIVGAVTTNVVLIVIGVADIGLVANAALRTKMFADFDEWEMLPVMPEYT